MGRSITGLLLGTALFGSLAAGAQIRGAAPMEFATAPLPAELKQRIELLGMLDLSPLTAQFPALVELSGLAWDADEQLLYAVSDRGHLVHLQPQFKDQRLIDVTAVVQHPLKNRHGQPLRGSAADAEGLTAVNQANGIPGDTRLLISFERRHRVAVHGPDGRYIKNRALPPALRTAKAYKDRNKSIEAITVHPTLGLLAAPEWPLRGAKDQHHTVFATNGTRITLPRLNAHNAGLVALEALPNGRLVVLERAHSWLTLTLIISLRVTEPLLAPPTAPSSLEVARFDSSLGWRVDNFEGLTRHQDNKFFLVSDDNGSGLQKTLLLYLQIHRIEL